MKSLRRTALLEPVFSLGLLLIAVGGAVIQPNSPLALAAACILIGSLLRALLPVHTEVTSTLPQRHWNVLSGARLEPVVEQLGLIVVTLSIAMALLSTDEDTRAAGIAVATIAVSMRLCPLLPVWASR